MKKKLTCLLIITVFSTILSLVPALQVPAYDAEPFKQEMEISRLDTSDTSVRVFCRHGVSDDSVPLYLRYENREFNQYLFGKVYDYQFNLYEGLELGQEVTVFYGYQWLSLYPDFFEKFDEYKKTLPLIKQTVVQLEKPLINKTLQKPKFIRGTGYPKSTMRAFVGKTQIGKAVCNAKGNFCIKVKPTFRKLLKKGTTITVRSSYKLEKKQFRSATKTRVMAPQQKREKTIKGDIGAVVYPGIIKLRKVDSSSARVSLFSSVPETGKADNIVLSSKSKILTELPIGKLSEYNFDVENLKLGEKLYVWTDSAYEAIREYVESKKVKAIVNLINSKDEYLDFAYDTITVRLQKPEIEKISLNRKKITGTGYAGSKVKIYKGKNLLGKATCDKKGKYTMKVKQSKLLKKGVEIKLVSTAKAKGKLYKSEAVVKVK